VSEPHKRTAYEPLERLARPTPYDPGMKRPASTVAGVVLVILGIVVDALWAVEATAHWNDDADGLTAVVVDDVTLTPDLISAGMAAFIVLWSVILLGKLAFAILVLRGWNWPRVVIMTFSVISITTMFIGWWYQGQEITLKTSLLSLGLDILVLLALSSRAAAAYARRAAHRAQVPEER